MKKGLILLVAITIFFSCFAASSNKGSIVVCATTEQYRIEALQEQLNERFPQYNVIVMYMSTGKAAAKIYAEGTDTEVDIILAIIRQKSKIVAKQNRNTEKMRSFSY